MEANCRSVNSALPALSDMLLTMGREEDTRNGRALVMPEPTMITFTHPRERVLFSPRRDANPFFHLFEAIWMLNGRQDVEFISQYNKNIANYSDDGQTFNAAYGFRWREHFGYDQIDVVIQKLIDNPEDRRIVMGMWDPEQDLEYTGKDVPCNTQIMFRAQGPRLEMTTINRSNDLVWGLLGANYVHMTFMMEYVATLAGLEVGKWHHFTNNLHVYERHWDLIELESLSGYELDPYPIFPLFQPYESKGDFDLDCSRFCDGLSKPFLTNFFQIIVQPMEEAWREHKAGRTESAIRVASHIADAGWSRACVDWLERRMP